jgi:hypothetical protein
VLRDPQVYGCGAAINGDHQGCNSKQGRHRVRGGVPELDQVDGDRDGAKLGAAHEHQDGAAEFATADARATP